MKRKDGFEALEGNRKLTRAHGTFCRAFPGSLWLEQARRVVKRVDARARATMELYDQLAAHRKWERSLKGGE